MVGWLWHGEPTIPQRCDVRHQRFAHAGSRLVPRAAERDDLVDVGGISALRTVIGLFVDDEVVLQRRSSNPVWYLIEARSPVGTVSEPLPATVSLMRPSGRAVLSRPRAPRGPET